MKPWLSKFGLAISAIVKTTTFLSVSSNKTTKVMRFEVNNAYQNSLCLKKAL